MTSNTEVILGPGSICARSSMLGTSKKYTSLGELARSGYNVTHCKDFKPLRLSLETIQDAWNLQFTPPFRQTWQCN